MRAWKGRLPSLRFFEFSGIVWRHTAAVPPPLDMLPNASRGGRFNPAFSFPMLYTSISVQGAKAEFIKSARIYQTAPEALLPRMLHQLDVNCFRRHFNRDTNDV